MPTFKTTPINKNGTVDLQENNRQRVKRLLRRIVSLEFSIPAKAGIDRCENSPRYRRIE
jgi:hypothetical protein